MRRIEARYGGGRTVRAWRARGAVYASLVSGPRHGGDDLAGERARRRVARETMAAYHEEQLLLLLERVRDGFRRLDAGEIDAFELDDLIHRYKRSARELWKLCSSSGSGWERAAGNLKYLREQGEELPDWWAAGEPRRYH